MKIGLKILTAVVVALLAGGCGSSDKGGEDESNYDGWVLTEWKGGDALAGTVYLQLGEDGTFTLYQSIKTFGYAKYTGTYTISAVPEAGQVLSGTYTDGTPLDNTYVVEKMTKKELRLRAQKDGIVSVYSGVTIPALVKDGITGKSLRMTVGTKAFL